MARFEIQLPDGSRYEVEARDAAQARRAIEKLRLKETVTKSPELREASGQRTSELNRRSEAAMVDERLPEVGWGMSVLQGVPFVGEYADEAIGYVAGKAGQILGKPGASPETATRDLRLAREGYQARRPRAAMANQFLGGAMGTVGALAAGGGAALMKAAPASLGGQMLMGGALGAGAGGAEGLVSGFGAGEGGVAPRMESAGTRGALGAGAGAVLGAAAPLVAKGGQAVAQALSRARQNRTMRTAGLSPKASRVIGEAMEEVPPAQALAGVRRGGPDAMVVDAAEPLRDTLDTAIQMGGGRGAREAIENRAAMAGQRLTSALDDHLGRPGESAGRALVPFGEKRSPIRLLYERAYRQPIDYSSVPGRRIERLVRENVPEAAIRKANRLIKADPDYAGVPQILARIDDAGNVVFEELPNVTQLDLITRALNDVADEAAGKGKMGGMTNEGRIYANLSRRIRDSLKEAVPEYRQALDAAGTEIGKLKARDLGLEVLSNKVWKDDAAEALRDMPAAELAKVKEGMRAYIDEIMARTQKALTDPNMDAREAAAGLRMLSSRSAREKLGMVLGPDEAQTLARQIDEAAASIELRAALSANSATFRRQQQLGRARELTEAGPLEPVLRGEPVNALQRGVQAFTGRTPDMRAGKERELWTEIARALTERRGPAAEQTVGALNQMLQRQPISEAGAQAFGQTAAGASLVPAYLYGSRFRQER